jgi:hypothetical protein
MVMMCFASRRLISLTRAASVVVLPDPVGPPTRTRPRGRRVNADARGQPERGEARHRRRQTPDRGGAAAFVMQVDAKAAEIGDAQRSVGDADVAKRLARVRRQPHDGVGDLLAAERPFVQRR